MSEKFKLAYNKTLKLQNVLIKEVIEEDFQHLDKTVTMMENYIKSKGMMAIGPLIQYMTAEINEKIKIKIISEKRIANRRVMPVVIRFLIDELSVQVRQIV
ncbi:MAG: hypothetical protein ACK5MV_04760 [Aminipila sp.]